MTTIRISPEAYECQITEVNIKELQAARLALMAEAETLEKQARTLRGYVTGITAALCIKQLSLGNK